MEIKNNVNNSNLSFQAVVPRGLKNELRNEALNMGSKAIKAVNTQIRRVETWGDTLSEIVMPMSLKGDMFERSASLSLYNNKLSTQYGAALPDKKSLFKSFMSLKEADITKAEKQIEDNVFEARMDLVTKAVQDANMMEKITGLKNPSDEVLAGAIERLSEEEVNKFRYGLNNSQLEGIDLIW